MKRIVWDWNGTLLNDVNLCFECINRLLVSKNLDPLIDLSAYRDIFEFPIQNYYQKAGFNFDKTPYEVLAGEYMKDYQEKSYDCQLFEDVYETLRKAHFFGFPQCILSASRKDYLLKQIEKFDILDYVDSVHGIENIYASSKKELARKYVESCPLEDEIWFVGDSIHDYEVANTLKANCILVTTGHQSRQKLERVDAIIADSLLESLEIIYETN